MTLSILRTVLVVSALLLVTGRSTAGQPFAADNPPRADNAALMAALEKSRSRLTQDPLARGSGEAKHLAVNYTQRLRALFSNDGLQVEPLDRDATQWRWALRLSSYGYGNVLDRIDAVAVSTLENRIEYRHRTASSAGSELTEWYVNRARGIEHGFTLPQPPQTRRDGELLHLALTVSGNLHARRARDGAIEFAADGDHAVLRYAELHAFDAVGRELPSRLEVQEHQVSLLVDDRSAQYPITIDPLIYSETKLTGSSGDADDFFGFAVATDGDTVAIGAPGDGDTGAVYVYTRSGGNWVEQAHLSGDGGGFSQEFGFSVAVQGNTLVVGDPSGAGGGVAWVFVRNRTSWTVQAYFTAEPLPGPILYPRLGTSVDVDGDTLVIGAPQQAIQPEMNQPNLFGTVKVYVRTGNDWDLQAWLLASDAAENDKFGASVAISGDVIVVGAPSDDFPSGAGSVYVYERDGEEWVEESHVFASDAAFGDGFGTSVDIAVDTVVVGAPFNNTQAGSNAGSAYVYGRNGNVWVEEAQLVAKDGAENDRFGSAVAAGQGLVAVGAPFDNTAAGTNAGSVHVFTRGTVSWRAQAKLTASDGSGGDQFGGSVALDASDSKTHVIVGAAHSNNATGAAYEYRYSTLGAELANAIKVIEDLVRVRTLTSGEGDVLIAHLNAAAESLDQNSLDAARHSIRGFVEMVASYADARILSLTDAQRLTGEVDWVFRLVMQ